VPRAALLTSDRVTADDPRVAACISAHRPHLSPVQVNMVSSTDVVVHALVKLPVMLLGIGDKW
jgi:hypothetical protein